MSGARGAAAVVAALAMPVAGCAGERSTPAAPEPLRVTVDRPGLLDDVATGVPAGGGRVVTVAHVLRAGAGVEVAGRPARVLRTDLRSDLAVVAVDGLRGAPLRLARDPGSLGAGTVRVLRDGAARTVAARVVRHVTAGVGRAGERSRVSRPALELDAAAVRAGDSGAPLTDRAGRVLGLVFARSAAPSRTAWAVDASALRDLLAAGRRR